MNPGCAIYQEGLHAMMVIMTMMMVIKGVMTKTDFDGKEDWTEKDETNLSM